MNLQYRLVAVAAVAVSAFLPIAPTAHALPTSSLPVTQATRLIGQLNLSPAQAAQAQIALKALRNTVDVARTNHAVARTRLEAELAKPRADLAPVAAMRAQNQQINLNNRLACQAEWIKLYNMLSDPQAKQVMTAMETALDRLDRLEATLDTLRDLH